MNKCHWSGLHSWPKTSITEQTSLQNTTPSSWEKKSLNSSWRPRYKHTLVSWRRRFQPFNLERKMWVIEKFRKHIWMQRPKIHRKQIFFLVRQNLCCPLLLAFCWNQSHLKRDLCRVGVSLQAVSSVVYESLWFIQSASFNHQQL